MAEQFGLLLREKEIFKLLQFEYKSILFLIQIPFQSTVACIRIQPMGKTHLKSLTLYVTAQEYVSITTDAREHGVTTSTYLRAVIDQYSPVKLPPLAKGAPPGNTNRRRTRSVSTENHP